MKTATPRTTPCKNGSTFRRSVQTVGLRPGQAIYAKAICRTEPLFHSLNLLLDDVLVGVADVV